MEDRPHNINSQKEYRKQCSNDRLIYVASTVSRLHGSILRDHIEEDYQDEKVEWRFHVGSSVNDNIFCLKQITEKKSARGYDSLLSLIDLEKAYDSITISKLWQRLKHEL